MRRKSDCRICRIFDNNSMQRRWYKYSLQWTSADLPKCTEIADISNLIMSRPTRSTYLLIYKHYKQIHCHCPTCCSVVRMINVFLSIRSHLTFHRKLSKNLKNVCFIYTLTTMLYFIYLSICCLRAFLCAKAHQ